MDIVATTKVLTLKMLTGKFKGIIAINEFKLSYAVVLESHVHFDFYI